jgi:nitric oxide reductase subunit B
VFGLLEGREGLELPRALDVYEGIMLVGFIIILSVNAPRSPLVRVWSIGIVVAVVGLLAGVLQPSDYVQDRVLRTLAVGLQINVGFPLAAAALGYWLIRRFSSVPRLWTDIGIYTVGGLLVIAGALVTLAPLFRLGGGSGAYWLGNIALFAVPILYLIFAAHSYGALSERTHTHSLAAHWYALSLLLLLIGVGFLGGLQSQADVGQWTAGTRLTDLQASLTLLGVTAMGLGMVNHTASDLYARQKRVNGLTPFWLVAFGILIGAAALGGAGIAQVYMERILSVGYLDVQTLVTPLYMLWMLGLLLLAAGIGVYALTFWLRRPSSDS